jgi:hypothetical protein
MVSGGARLRSGPAPDPNALRRDRKSDAGWSVLPAEGVSAPTWPFEDFTARESTLWRELWAKPQGHLWLQNGQLLEVALHVRCFAEAEQPAAATPLRTLVRQQADALLLTMPAMLAARIKIAGDEVGAKRAAPEPAAGVVSSRSRLKAVKDDGGT